MKKILLFLLILTMSIPPVFVFAEENEVGQILEAYEDEAEVLINLGIITSYDMNGYEPYAYISNREFLDMLNSLSGGEKITDYAEYAESLGVMNSMDRLQKYIYPTYDFAVTAALGVLGYSKINIPPEKKGTNWYITQAKRSGLLSGLSYSAEKSLRRGDAVKLLHNMLEAEVLRLDKVEIDEDGYVKSILVPGKETAMYYFSKVYKKSGILTETDFTSMYGESSLGEDTVSVDNVVYGTKEGADFNRYVGMYCDVYISEKSGEETVLSVSPEENVRSIEIDVDDFESYEINSRKFGYIKDDKTTFVELEKSVSVIKNGLGLKSFGEKDFDISSGMITLYDNDRNGKYDLAVIDSAEIFIVDKVNSASRTIYNKLTYDSLNKKLEVDERKKENKITITRNSESIELSDISKNEILEIYYSSDAEKKIIRINVTGKKVSGNISYISDEYVELGGVKYAIADSYRKACEGRDEYAPELKVGAYYMLFINSDNKVVAADSDVLSDMKAGYLYAIASSGAVFNNSFKVKLFTEDGEWKTYTLADKLDLNGERMEDEDVYNRIVDLKEQMILYKMNKSEEITEIKTGIDAAIADDDDFSALGYQDRYYKGGTVPSFDDEHYVGADSVIISIPPSGREEEFQLISSGRLESYLTYNTALYDIDDYNLCKYVVIKKVESMQNTLLNQGATMLVSEAMEVMGADGTIVKQISGNSGFLTKYAITFSENAEERKTVNGSQVFTKELSMVQKGDFVRFLTDVSGNIRYFEVLGTTSNKENYYPPKIYDYATYFRGSVIKSDASKCAILLNIDGTQKPVVGNSSTKVFIAEGNGDRCAISNGTMDDIVPDDYVLVLYPRGLVTTVVIYRD